MLLLLPGIGWLLNMGHRVMVVHRMQHGEAPWPSWRGYPELLRHGCITFGGMLYYFTPSLLLGWYGWVTGRMGLVVAAGALGLAAFVAIPGYMSHYCREFDVREIYDPFRALRRCLEGGRQYWRAWGIALVALALSFLGLLALGVGFLVTSVWFWQVAAFSFATGFTQRFALSSPPPPEIG